LKKALAMMSLQTHNIHIPQLFYPLFPHLMKQLVVIASF
jgi:hypothetical protein